MKKNQSFILVFAALLAIQPIMAQEAPQTTTQPSQWFSWFQSLRRPKRTDVLKAKRYINSKWRCLRHGEGCSRRERNILRSLAVAAGVAIAGGVRAGYRKWTRKIDYTQQGKEEQQRIRRLFRDAFLGEETGRIDAQAARELFQQYKMPSFLLNHWITNAIGVSTSEIVQIMLENDADPSYVHRPPEAAHFTMLGRAILRSLGNEDEVENSEVILQLLLKAGAEINSTESHKGHTALMFSVDANLPSLAQILLDNNADTAIKNEIGETAYDFAIKKGTQNDFPDELKPNN